MVLMDIIKPWEKYMMDKIHLMVIMDIWHTI